MKINLEIIDSTYVYAPKQIELLNTKELVPQMIKRRRLTRAAKIAIYLANEVSFEQGRIIYGSSYGEALSTTRILNSINEKEAISPTVFQNSVYNTAVSYLSIILNNKSEMMTISSGDNTSLNILKSGAIKALDGDTILLLATETLDLENINDLNDCTNFLECGVALKVKVTTKEANLNFMNFSNKEKFPPSLRHMLNISRNIHKDKQTIVTISI